MKATAILVAGAAATVVLAAAGDAHARIQCDGPFQVTREGNRIATPYCEDEYLAQVARGYGMRVSGRAIRRNPSRKEDVCKTMGHDSRVYDICLKYRDDGRERFRN